VNVGGSIRATIQEHWVPALLVALTWILLFKINTWLFASIEVNGHISLVFLPAFLRMVAAMVWRWSGVAGLFMGGLFTSSIWTGGSVVHASALAALSALGPLLAVTFCTKWLGLDARLDGLKGRHVLQFAATGALVNTLLHNLYFYTSGMQPSLMDGVLPMLIGDLLGTVVVLFGLSSALKVVSSRKR
jgi:hypothetical protein